MLHNLLPGQFSTKHYMIMYPRVPKYMPPKDVRLRIIDTEEEISLAETDEAVALKMVAFDAEIFWFQLA